MQVWQLVEVICDTSFVLALASNRIKNISNIETEIGPIEFIVPNLVIQELERISLNNKKKVLPSIL